MLVWDGACALGETMEIKISESNPIFGKIYHNILFYPSTLHYLSKELKGCNSVLDIGCGSDSVLRYTDKKAFSIGIDAFLPSLIKSRAKQIHSDYIFTDIRKFCLKKKSFDIILLHEVIEHLTREEGVTLIKKLVRIAKKKIILSTPNGFFYQDEYDSNPFQKHKSGWTIEDLKIIGFTNFKGVGGLKKFRRKNASYYDNILIQCFPQKVSYFFPEYANGIIATKYLEDLK